MFFAFYTFKDSIFHNNSPKTVSAEPLCLANESLNPSVYLQVGHSEQRQQGEGHQVEKSGLSSTMDPGGHSGSQQT